MSTNYYTKFFIKNKITNDWKELSCGCCNKIKSLICGWDINIDTSNKEITESLNKLAIEYTTIEYLATVDKKYLSQFGEYKTYNNHSKENCVLLTNNDEELINKVKEYDIILCNEKEWKKLTNNEKNDDFHFLMSDWIKHDINKYVNIYIKVTKTHNGNFYDINSFISKRKELEDKMKKLYYKKFEWENLKKSVEYLKLSNEEKENICSEYEYLDEDIEDIEYGLDSCNYFIHLFEYMENDMWYTKEFKSFDENVSFDDGTYDSEIIMWVYSY